MWKTLFLSLLFLGACGPAEKNNPPQAKQEKPPKPKVHEVKQVTFVARDDVQSFPFRPHGLRFQMDPFEVPGALKHKPIGQALITEHNHVILSFPERFQIVKFEAPQFDTKIWGTKEVGGNQAPVRQPQTLAYFDQKLFSGEQKSGHVFELNLDGQMTNFFDLGKPAVAIGPDGKGLVADWQNIDLLIRQNRNGQREQGYRISGLLEAFGLKGLNPQGPVQITADWEVFYGPSEPSILFHIGQKTLVKLAILTDLGSWQKEVSWQLADLKFKQEHYWLLYTTGEKSRLVMVNPAGEPQTQWELPFPADGFDYSPRLFLLYNKAEGMAQTYLVQ